MKFSEIDTLVAALSNNLPGEAAQFKMASSFRVTKEYIEEQRPKARLGSVMVLLFPVGDEIHTVLTLRTSYKGVHSGQVSFPGGKKDEADIDLNFTAIRETWEEIGVPDYDIQLVGNLTEIYIPASNFIVRPMVGIVQQQPEFHPNHREVEKIIVTPISVLLDDTIRKQTKIKVTEEFIIDAPYFDIDNHVVWGATAMILSELCEVIRPLFYTEAV